jgi:hypothetical protein
MRNNDQCAQDPEAAGRANILLTETQIHHWSRYLVRQCFNLHGVV